MLFCCPICAGTWVDAALLGLMAINYSAGYYAVVALAIGGAGRIVIRLAEMLEWQSRYAQERVAELNRRNAREEAEQHSRPYILSRNGNHNWVLNEEEIEERIHR